MNRQNRDCVRDRSEQSCSCYRDMRLLSGVQRGRTQALRAWGYWCRTGQFSYTSHRNPISDPSSLKTRLFSQRLALASVSIPHLCQAQQGQCGLGPTCLPSYGQMCRSCRTRSSSVQVQNVFFVTSFFPHS